MTESDEIMYKLFKDMLQESLKPTNDKIDSMQTQIHNIQKDLKWVDLVNVLVENKKVFVCFISFMMMVTSFFGYSSYQSQQRLTELTQQVQENHRAVLEFYNGSHKK